MTETNKERATEWEQPSPPSILWRVLSNQKVAALASLCSILGLATGVYFYLQGNKAPELTLWTNPYRAQIVQGGAVGGLRVTLGEQEIRGSVFVAQLSVWNNGSLAIRQGDVLTPIVVTSKPAVRILEIRTKKVTRKDIAFRATSSDDKGRINLHWTVLEPDDAALIEVVCEGDGLTSFLLDGAVIGQRTLVSINEKPSAPAGPRTLPEPREGSVIVLGVVSFLSTVTFVLSSDIARSVVRRMRHPQAMWIVFVMQTLALFGLVAYLVFTAFRLFRPVAPFAF